LPKSHLLVNLTIGEIRRFISIRPLVARVPTVLENCAMHSRLP
jgi:hypothetical protein